MSSPAGFALIDARYRKFPDGTLRTYGRPPLGIPVSPPVITHGHAEFSRITGFALDGSLTPDPPVVPGNRNVNAGAIPSGLQTDPVPTTGVVKFVNFSSGSDAAAGTLAAPWKTLQFAMNNAAANSTVVIRAGTTNEGGDPGVAGDLGVVISEGTVGARAGITLMAYPNETVIMDGTIPVTGWTVSTIKPGTNVWRAAYSISLDQSVQFARGSVDGTTAGYVWLNAGDARGKVANYYDQLFTVSSTGQRTPMTLVGTSAELGPGKFWVEGTITGGTSADKNVFNATAVYIGTDPASVSSIRASNRTTAFTILAQNFTFKGITIQGYAAGNSDGGVLKVRRSGATVQDVTILDSSAVALDVYLNTRPGPTTFRRVTVQRAGLNCVHVEKGDGLNVYDSLFERSNTHNWNMAPAAGGMKITSSIGIRIWRSKFNNHNGDGFWCDASVFDTQVITCDAFNNSGHGFEYEISAKAMFVDCIAVNNSKDGFLNRCSDQVEYWYCTTTGAAEVPMDTTQDNRATAAGPVTGVFGQDTRYAVVNGGGGKDDPVYGSIGMYWWIKKVTIQNCVIVKPSTTRTGGALRIRTQGITRSIADYGPVVNGNLYSRISATAPVNGWVLITTGYSTFAAYKSAAAAAGVTMDANGINLDGHDVLNSDYSLKTADDTAANAVVPGMNATIAALLGRPVGTKHVGAFL